MSKYYYVAFFFLFLFADVQAQNMNHPSTAQQSSKRVRKIADRPERVLYRKRPLPVKDIRTTMNWIDFAVAFNFDFENPDKDRQIEISSAGQLAYLAKTVNDGYNFEGIHFKLTSNINLDGREWTPIGMYDANARFCGIFNGNGFRIENLTITQRRDYAGLFGVCGKGSHLENINLENAYVVGQMSVGGLAGEMIEGVITGCSVSGYIVASNEYVGGLIGVNGGKIINSRSTAEVHGNSNDTGGLAGVNGDIFPGTIENSVAEGFVTGYWNVGGFVGRNAGDITNSHATGDVEGEDWVGGFAGWTDLGTIKNCHATGNVTGFFDVGGLVGFNGYAGSTAQITGSSASGDVSGNGPGNHCIGGLAGFSGGIITDSHATGFVDGEGAIGGLAGENGGRISNSYATGNVMGHFDTGGLVGFNGHVRSRALIENSRATGRVWAYGPQNYAFGGLAGYSGGRIVRSFATGNTSGDDTIGGLVGENEGIIENSFSKGTVTARRLTAGGLVGWNWGRIEYSFAAGQVNSRRNSGGLIGQNQDSEAVVISGFFDRQTTRQSRGAGINNNERNSSIEALSTQELQSGRLPAGFNAAIWETVEGEYPRLKGGH